METENRQRRSAKVAKRADGDQKTSSLFRRCLLDVPCCIVLLVLHDLFTSMLIVKHSVKYPTIPRLEYRCTSRDTGAYHRPIYLVGELCWGCQ